MQRPADVVNRALDALGLPERAIGDIESDGTTESEAARRIYGPTLRQLLRSAHWSFARKRAPLQLLADRLGQSLTPQGNPLPAAVEFPWHFAYAWPIDGVRPRWLPWNGTAQGATPAGNITIGSAPLMPNLALAGNGPWAREIPARFLSSTSDQFPAEIGLVDWPQLPDLDGVEGVGPITRRIILADVPAAELVYTRLALDIETWDELFGQAMVAVVAERLALSCVADKKEAIALRNAQIAIARNALAEARTASANEAGFPQSTDQVPDWIRARRAGGLYGGAGWDAGAGPGYFSVGWEGFAFGDGSVF